MNPTRAAFLRRLIDDPFDLDNRLIFADWLDEHDEVAMADILRARRIPLDELDQSAACHLWSCNFSPGSWDKKFASTIAAFAVQTNSKIKVEEVTVPSCTPRQYLWLWLLCHRYRRQIRSERVKEEAARRLAGYTALVDVKVVPPDTTPRMKGKARLQDMPLFD